ncbi:hypothetical protein Cgig2_023753 [Carnegiea gigantea]|uniref:DUF4283 domain-containing protein n=1 Tax=Carnegiea gigantea TaxID=171969 RepID=A0A9Q1QIK7_9CARY|nr:hypothetical protein Cgig2_023753 [Carnegiea gigantea]
MVSKGQEMYMGAQIRQLVVLKRQTRTLYEEKSNETVHEGEQTKEDASLVSDAPHPEVITHQLNSYASLVDPEEGTALKYVPIPEINGQTCAKIEKQDIQSEVYFWSIAVICGVMGANPPVEVIEGYVHRIWASKDMDKDKMAVLQKGIYFFNRKPFIVKAWNEGLRVDIHALRSVPIWVQFTELDTKYWEIESLSKLGSMLGIPLMTNKTTKEKSALHYTRLLIEISLEGPFPDHIDFINDWGVVGYEESNCKRKNPERQGRRAVQNIVGSQEEGTPIR